MTDATQHSEYDKVLRRIEALLDPMASGLLAGWTRYREMEREWWDRYCDWKREADRRARAVLDPHLVPYKFGGLAVNEETFKRLTAGKIGEAKAKSGRDDRFTHVLEGLPVRLKPPLSPVPPGAWREGGAVKLNKRDRDAIAAARLLRLVSSERRFNCAIDSSVCEAVATSGAVTIPDAIMWLPRFEKDIAGGNAPRSRKTRKRSPQQIADTLLIGSAYSTARHVCGVSIPSVTGAMRRLCLLGDPDEREVLVSVDKRRSRPVTRLERQRFRDDVWTARRELADAVFELIVQLRRLAVEMTKILPRASTVHRVSDPPIQAWKQLGQYRVSAQSAIECVYELGVAVVVGMDQEQVLSPFLRSSHYDSMPPDSRARVLAAIELSWRASIQPGPHGWHACPSADELDALNVKIEREQAAVMPGGHGTPPTDLISQKVAAVILGVVPKTVGVYLNEGKLQGWGPNRKLSRAACIASADTIRERQPSPKRKKANAART